MSTGLLRKEWREHRGAGLLFLIFYGLLLLLLVTAGDRYATRGSIFELLKLPTVMLSTVGAIFVSHRLVVREYGQRTQLFLEALPLSRARILVTKLVLGAAVLLLPLALTLGMLGSMEAVHKDVTPHSLLPLWLRSATPVLLGWTFFALAGLVGRFRNPLYILLVIGLFAADQLTDFELAKSGPFALLGPDFSFERQRLPWEHLATCWALIAVATGLCFGLVLYRDGTLTELLSQRMSHREKVFVACVLTGLFVVITMMDQAKRRQPFSLRDAARGQVAHSTVQVASGIGFPREDAERMAERLATDLGALSGYLGLERLPAVAVMPIRELDADVFQRAKLEEADGVVVRANLAAPDFDVRAFEAFLFREVLIWASEGVVLREERQWLLDGFTTWWAHRDGEARLSPRAAVASRDDFDTRRWLGTRERLGPCLSGALAALGVQVLRERLGDGDFQSLIQGLLAPPRRTGFWGLAMEPRLGALLSEHGGLTEDELARRWREALRGEREAHAALVESLAALSPALSVVAESEETFRLEHALRGSKNVELPARYALLYGKLTPFGHEVSPDTLSRQDAPSSAPDGARLPRTLVRGERWLFVMQVESAPLGCPVRVLAERRAIP
ncbi:hypothetical protein HPC49_03730 [Pyxidicoccus fallax]|uniref:Uncharacterized protein n=1 Tax=Pyxidicoccus fallax TaxID=394095 RepID=A0A848L7R7_9BACT|nr:hypothetical protein [Pyxidicoccus fallax]NMO14597.1 hypothetical protein [Pyxidicoccus fallax]NPC77361.1 hypothetical protein [Pyxidicoccus fallax]